MVFCQMSVLDLLVRHNCLHEKSKRDLSFHVPPKEAVLLNPWISGVYIFATFSPSCGESLNNPCGSHQQRHVLVEGKTRHGLATDNWCLIAARGRFSLLPSCMDLLQPVA